jgi:hypothetical protein
MSELRLATSTLIVGPIGEKSCNRPQFHNQCTLERISSNRWFFAILRNIGGFAYFPLKCGGFLEFSHGQCKSFIIALKNPL